MNAKKTFGIGCLLAATMIGLSQGSAAGKGQKPELATKLTVAGEKLQRRYADMLAALQAEISQALPAVDEQKKTAYLKAREAEKAAEAEANTKQATLNANRGAAGLLAHRQGWIGRAGKGVAEAKEKLKQAEAMKGDNKEAVKAAKEALAKIQENYDTAASELKKSQAAVDKAKLEEPKLLRALQAAQDARPRPRPKR